MIKIISRENIAEFDQAVPALERAMDRTRLSLFWSIENLRHAVVNQEAWVFIQEESGFAGAFNIGHSPVMRYLNWFWAGQDVAYNNTPDYDEVQQFLEYCARVFGLTHITTEGRKGWTPLAKQQGYDVDSVIFIKEVPNGGQIQSPDSSQSG